MRELAQQTLHAHYPCAQLPVDIQALAISLGFAATTVEGEALSKWGGRYVVGQGPTKEMQRYTLANALSHRLLGHNVGENFEWHWTVGVDPRNTQAHDLALALLVPEHMLNQTPLEIATLCGIPVELAARVAETAPTV